MSDHKFFVCKHCGNVAALALSSGVPLVCCGEKMAELAPNTTDAATEKHVPVVTKTDSGITVSIGSVAHPMESGHHIAFVYVQTKNGGQKKVLSVGSEPTASFSFVNDEPIAAYAYCNLHGLWKCEI